MTEALVVVERSDAVVQVTLNRPHALNALSVALKRELAETFTRLQQDESVDAIVLTGAGRAFCVGLDLKELGGETSDKSPLDMDDVDVAGALAGVRVPIIAAINGYAITGGFELALMCDILLGAAEARFADTHARVGVVPGWGLSQRLPRLIGWSRAKQMSLTGNYIDAHTAERWGLINQVYAADELLPAAHALARDIADTDRTVRLEINRLIDEGLSGTLAEGLELERAANVAHKNTNFSRAGVAERRAAIQARARQQTR
tara:strand:+ start:769 stop:1551 length:783 start_codon:yes stop_codon:yes gene_type:complete